MLRFCSVVSTFFILLSLSGCSDVQPIWKGTSELKGFTMYYSEPCEYQVDLSKRISEPIQAMLELELTYYVGTNRTNLPLFVVLEDEQHKLQEYTTNIILKAEGEWLGIPAENEIDYTLSHIAIPKIELQPKVYTLRIYANDEEAERLSGIVEIAARFYEHMEGSELEAGGEN